MKVLLCVQVKLENSYIREWIEYHKNIGFSHIIVSDNNDMGQEDSISAINDYVDDGFVTIDYTYKNRNQGWQSTLYTEICNKYHNEYDWITFFDLDEFLYIPPKYKNICDFLESNNNFNNFDGITLSWLTYGDNGYIESSSFDVLDRFDSQNNMTNDIYKNLFFKSIINCKKWNTNKKFFDAHGLTFDDHSYCNCYGNLVAYSNQVNIPYNNSDAVYLKHFITKSLNEYINQKEKRGLQWSMYGSAIDLYKDINGWPQEYENYYQFRINGSIEKEKNILICIFYEHEKILDILNNVSYINQINYHSNIHYKFCHSNDDLTNIYFETYFNVFKDIYENDNNYDVIVCINEKTYLNLHLLNRFINIIYDENKIYTEMIQCRGLGRQQISERMFTISKKQLEQIIKSELFTSTPDSLYWFPSYAIGAIFENVKIMPLGYIYFYDNEICLNTDTESIFTYILYVNYDDNNFSKINNSFAKLTKFINDNTFSYILRLPNIKYYHFGDYIDFNKKEKISDTIKSYPLSLLK